jgi:hypothetical protein
MNADEILARVRAGGEQPANWTVFPLLRHKVVIASLGWIGGMIMGGGLLAFVTPIVVPGNYQQGLLAAIATTLILGMLAFIFVGSLVLLVFDMRRLSEVEKHIIVITDEDFVKQEGKRVIQVPLAHVRYVTARGRVPTENDLSADAEDGDISLRQIPHTGESVPGIVSGRGAGAVKTRRKRMRTPTSLWQQRRHCSQWALRHRSAQSLH